MLPWVEAPRGWIVAAPLEDLEREGAAVTFDVGRERILLVRGAALRAFHNVCQHRGHPLVERPCRVTKLRCPYHGWTYDLDGRLRHAPDRDAFGDLGAISLPAIALAARPPFAWIRLVGDDPVPTDLDDLAGWRVVERAERRVARTTSGTRVDRSEDVVVARVAPTIDGWLATAWRLAPPAAPVCPSAPLLDRIGLAPS